MSLLQKDSEQKEIVNNIIIGAFKHAKYDTPLHQKLAKILGVSSDGSSLLDITSILESFHGKYKSNLSAEQTTKILIDSLDKAGLKDIVSQFRYIQNNVRGGKAENTEPFSF